MKKRITVLTLMIILFVSPLFLSGCTHEMVSLYIYQMPNKLVYEIGDKLSTEGLKLKNIKTDSALLKVWLKDATFEGFDSSTSGKKTITITYGDFSTSYTVFVANKVVSPTDNLNDIIETASDGDIILLKEGKYSLEKPLEINSSIVLAGEKGKVEINGNIIIGGSYEDGNYNFVNTIENISLIGLNFSTKSSTEENVLKFEKEYISSTSACVNGKDFKSLSVINCNFSGYSYGILGETGTNCQIIHNTFENLKIGGLEISKNCTNSLIKLNIFQNIGNGIVVMEDENTQGNVFGIKMGFNKSENVGVTLFKNSISKIGLNTGKLTYVSSKTKGNFTTSNFMKNSAGIILFSTGENNLQTTGISVFNNSIGTTLNNILYSTNKNNFITSSSINFLAP